MAKTAQPGRPSAVQIKRFMPFMPIQPKSRQKDTMQKAQKTRRAKRYKGLFTGVFSEKMSISPRKTETSSRNSHCSPVIWIPPRFFMPEI